MTCWLIWETTPVISQYGLSTMQNNLGRVLRPIRSGVSGDFYAESQFAGDIEIGQPQNRSAKVLLSSPSGEGVALTGVELDKETLANEGFGDVSLTIAPVR
ncbi:MAG: aerolysin family beta-barrel pore-forming toxin [Aeromonas sobria]|uniref:aerolysin family beta-barrel pore-forming toxin n=1 Tax=Aeromonas sobria TaxID=646 RepID=UPI003F3AEB98